MLQYWERMPNGSYVLKEIAIGNYRGTSEARRLVRATERKTKIIFPWEKRVKGILRAQRG